MKIEYTAYIILRQDFSILKHFIFTVTTEVKEGALARQKFVRAQIYRKQNSF